ncbi:MAG: ABC transporter ATP-binding protein [Chloroflexota bacterium]
MIRVDRLGFRYVGRRRPTLLDVSFDLVRGESILVLGPSGCGKSTLALCLNGAIPHSVFGDLTGTVTVDGLDTRTAPMSALAQRVGVVFQDPEAQFCMLTVADEVAFGLENVAVPREEMDSRIDAALAQVGLLDRREERIERLSGGQKQRLALACVLALRPAVLVLDEPTAQLDPEGAAELISLIGRLREGGEHALVLIEHRLDEVMHLVDRVLVLDREGRTVADGPPRVVLGEHGRALSEQGVWIPQVTEMALAIESEPPASVTGVPLTVDEAALLGTRQPELRAVVERATATARSARGASSTLIEVRDLSFRYPAAQSKTIQEVSLAIGAGELVAIVGANGAGKSTLARLMAGILPAPPGAIRLDRADLAALPRREAARQVGYVFQYPEHQFVGRTVLDDVAYGMRVAGVGEALARERARDMLADFGLTHLELAHPFTLSHGEQRRLSVAAMLVLGQRLLILDEPTFGQDRRNAHMLLDKLEALADGGKAVVMISHDMRAVAERARRALVMANGRVVFDGEPNELFADRALLRRASLRQPPVWELMERLRGAAVPA